LEGKGLFILILIQSQYAENEKNMNRNLRNLLKFVWAGFVSYAPFEKVLASIFSKLAPTIIGLIYCLISN